MRPRLMCEGKLSLEGRDRVSGEEGGEGPYRLPPFSPRYDLAVSRSLKPLHDLRAQAPHRRADPDRPAEAARRRHASSACRARATWPRWTRSTTRATDPLHLLPPGGRRRHHGRGLRQAHRPARHLLRHARARAPPTPRRRPHRLPGFDADDPAHRPGGARHAASARRFQEIDYRRMFGPMAKWVAEIDDADAHPRVRQPRLPHRHVRAARAGGAGAARGHAARDRERCADAGPYKSVQAHPARARWPSCASGSPRAERPFVILGGGGWSEAASRRHDGASPRPTTCRSAAPSAARTCFDNDAPLLCRRYRRRPQPEARGADQGQPTSLLVVGARLGEMTTERLHAARRPAPAARPWSMSIRAPRSWAASTRPTCRSTSGMARVRRGGARAAAASERRLGGRTAARRTPTSCAWIEAPAPSPGALQTGRDHGLAARAACRRDAIVTNGAGNYTIWAHRYYRYRRYGTQLAPTSGSMGYGAAGGASRPSCVHPERMVVCFAGDGCFLMTGQELATAVQYGAADRSSSSSTTACTAPSACTRSATIPAASSAPTSQPRLRRAGPRLRRASASGSSAPRNSRRPSSARWRRHGRR